MEQNNIKTPYDPTLNKNSLRNYRYDIFYDINGDMATATVRGKSIKDAKMVFKKIYGGWKITNVQRLK